MSKATIHKISPDTERDECPQCHWLEWRVRADLDHRQAACFENLISHQQPVKRFDKLCHTGSKFSSLFMAHSGSFKLSAMAEDGNESIVRFSFPGEMMGFSAIGLGVHLFDIVALEDSTVCALQFDEFERMCCDNPKLRHIFNAAFSLEIGRSYRQQSRIGFSHADGRIAGFLLDLSATFARRGFSAKVFNLTMTRKDIGAYLGIGLECVSRMLTSFQEQHFIDVNGKRLEIIDHAGLRDLCVKEIGADEPPVKYNRRNYIRRKIQ